MTTDVEGTGGNDGYEDDEDNTPIRLSQLIRIMFVDVNNESIDSNNEEKDNINSYAVRYSFRLISIVCYQIHIILVVPQVTSNNISVRKVRSKVTLRDYHKILLYECATF